MPCLLCSIQDAAALEQAEALSAGWTMMVGAATSRPGTPSAGPQPSLRSTAIPLIFVYLKWYTNHCHER